MADIHHRIGVRAPQEQVHRSPSTIDGFAWRGTSGHGEIVISSWDH